MADGLAVLTLLRVTILSALLKARADAVLDDWRKKARAVNDVAKKMPRLVLDDNMGGVLAEIISALEREETLSERNPNVLEHGKQRLQIGFDLNHVVREYGLLRDAILDLAESHRISVSILEFRLIAESITVGIRDAVMEYSSSRNRTYEMLVGVLGHDLRNPLNAISTGASLLLRQGGSTPEVVTRICTRISSSAERMSRLIEQLLDFTRAGIGGGFALDRKWTDLTEVAQNLAEELELSHPGREVQCHSDGNCTGIWDADRLRQALENLLSNALLHGSQYEPVELRLEGSDHDVMVEVHNQGSPIAAKELSAIFDPFRRDARPTSGGLGMGLYVVQQIVSEHDGTVEAESSDTTGTVFRLRLPKNTT